MEAIFLGTGTSQGVPIIGCKCSVCTSKDPKDKRLRSSLIFRTESHNILIDIGPDFRQQMLTNHIDKIDAVFISHEHNDHIIGLDDIRPINFKWRKDIPIYAETRILNEIETRFSYIFAHHPYPGLPQVVLHEVSPKEPIRFGQDQILPLRIIHGKLPILAFKIKKFAYITDANSIPESSIDELSNLEYLVINALRNSSHHSHFNLKQALSVIKVLNPEKAFIIHMSHHIGLHEEVSQKLPSNVNLAYDGLKVKF